jgi:hypothetical protein
MTQPYVIALGAVLVVAAAMIVVGLLQARGRPDPWVQLATQTGLSLDATGGPLNRVRVIHGIYRGHEVRIGTETRATTSDKVLTGCNILVGFLALIGAILGGGAGGASDGYAGVQTTMFTSAAVLFPTPFPKGTSFTLARRRIRRHQAERLAMGGLPLDEEYRLTGASADLARRALSLPSLRVNLREMRGFIEGSCECLTYYEKGVHWDADRLQSILGALTDLAEALRTGR